MRGVRRTRIFALRARLAEHGRRSRGMWGIRCRVQPALVVWRHLHRGIAHRSGMFSLDHKQTGLIIDYCLGLSPPSEAEEVEQLIARNDRAANWHSQVQTALAFLSYVPAEPCPDRLAELTVHRLRTLAARRASAGGPKSRGIGVDRHQWFRRRATVRALAASIVVFAGILIPSLDSMFPNRSRQAPTEQVERTSTEMHLGDSDYARLPILDESQGTESVRQVPGLFAGASGSAEYYPRRMDHTPELGPRVMPTSWEHDGEQRSQDHLPRFSPWFFSDQSWEHQITIGMRPAPD